MKYLPLFLSAMFLFFAVLQINDPDPVRWILLYSFVGFASMLTALEEKGAYFGYALIAGLAISAVWAVSMLPDFVYWMEVGTPSIISNWYEGNMLTELVREFLGLVMCTVVNAVYLYLCIMRQQVRQINRAVVKPV